MRVGNDYQVKVPPFDPGNKIDSVDGPHSEKVEGVLRSTRPIMQNDTSRTKNEILPI